MDSDDNVSPPETYSELVLRENPLPETNFELGQSDVIIGRSPSADFVISFAAVSGRHAKVSYADNQYSIEDLNSSNGTYINGAKLPPSVPRILQNGDEIRLGLAKHVDPVDGAAENLGPDLQQGALDLGVGGPLSARAIPDVQPSTPFTLEAGESIRLQLNADGSTVPLRGIVIWNRRQASSPVDGRSSSCANSTDSASTRASR